jgi:hypothetical protein
MDLAGFARPIHIDGLGIVKSVGRAAAVQCMRAVGLMAGGSDDENVGNTAVDFDKRELREAICYEVKV